jgi:acetate kinase
MNPANIVLCLNAGSSSLKFALFDLSNGEKRLAQGAVEGIGQDQGRARIRWAERTEERAAAFPDFDAALGVAFELLGACQLPAPHIVGHRVVHGGAEHMEPALIDAALLASLEALVPIAPLHLPASIAAMKAARQRFAQLPQVACFDTAFHRHLPLVARRLPIPERLDQEGLRRYGFHGLSYEYVMSVLGPERPLRIVIAHLGNGASLVAVKDGASIDTTMGFTPTGGIPMGTRSGDLDPGVLLYLLREGVLSAPELDALVEHESGLLGVGGDSDVKKLLERAPHDERARLALDLFAYAVKKTVGAFAAALGGLDLLIFTGGIGEHAAEVRAEACRGLDFLGVTLDDAKNRAHAPFIGSGPCAVRIVATDEELVIARHAGRLVAR